MSSAPVAVIDIGSNSIKVLVATLNSDGQIIALKMRTLDARISAGISRADPRLTDDGMARGIEAVQTLLANAAPFSPQRIQLVATSAVRDAANGGDFRTRLRELTGHDVRILSGEEEANLIGRGLICDRALAARENFYVFDLGGGSLECLAFRHRQIEQAVSLPLGCVRLMERFVSDVGAPFPASAAVAISKHTQSAFAATPFHFSLPADAVAVGTGGTFTTARAIFAARAGHALEEIDPVITLAQLRELLDQLGAMPLRERREVSGLPAARADVFPTALATLIAVAEIAGFTSFVNSLYNLRWGIAAEMLEQAKR